MRKRPRITRFDGAVLADALFLIGQAWVRGEDGDEALSPVIRNDDVGTRLRH